MQKIPSVFKRDYEGTRLVYDEVVPGCEWVLGGEGVATVKFDGTACLIHSGVLYKRYDRKMSKSAQQRAKSPGYQYAAEDFKPVPDGWIAAESAPDVHSGHWPGWLPISAGPEDQWHREALALYDFPLPDGTYELVGPKVQGNPYHLGEHEFWRHGNGVIPSCPRDFEGIRALLANSAIEGIVWHHPDGRMAKIKRRDFGLAWPVDTPNPAGDDEPIGLPVPPDIARELDNLLTEGRVIRREPPTITFRA